MKVTCDNCSKRFEYEKYMGICPACRRYTAKRVPWTSEWGEGIEKPNGNQKSKELNEPKELHKPEKIQIPQELHKSKESQTTRGNRKKDVKSAKVTKPKEGDRRIENLEEKTGLPWEKTTITLVVIMILYAFFVQFVVMPYEWNKVYEAQKYEEVPYVPIRQGVKFLIGDTDFKIHKVEPFFTEEIAPPKGWKYIWVPYTVEKEMLRYDESIALKVFLEMGDNYVQPLNFYEFPEYSLEAQGDGIAFLEKEAFQKYFKEGKSGFVFLVPEESEEYVLNIYQHEINRQNVVSKLEGVYQISLKEGR